MTSDPIIEAARKLALNTLRRMLIVRAGSYKRVFMAGGAIGRDAEIVLADLRDYCFGNSTTFHADPHEAARRQGRRETWLRLTQHLNLDEEKVQKLVELDDGL